MQGVQKGVRQQGLIIGERVPVGSWNRRKRIYDLDTGARFHFQRRRML
jgi:hypothetical protein